MCTLPDCFNSHIASHSTFQPLRLQVIMVTSWEKYTNFEMGARVPMMMRVPGIPPSRTAALVESVDIFPSLVEAATAGAAALPACPPGTTGFSRAARLCTEGLSFVPAMRSPTSAAVQKHAAFSQYTRPNNHINGGVPYARGLPPYPQNVPDAGGTEGVMGYTVSFLFTTAACLPPRLSLH